jgi:hypothetical protein
MKATQPRNLAYERHLSLNRRGFLRSVGVCLALPVFESFKPLTAFAASTGKAARLAESATGAPLRTVFTYFPNGAIPDAWWPEQQGANYEFSRTLQPLQKLRQHVQILGGLDHVNATPGDDGAGDHARANATFLTGMRARKTDSQYIYVGESIDQILAKRYGHLTRLPSLELSCDPVRKSGRCDSGYSCAYQYNISWQSPTTPRAPEANPRLVFERLFGAGSASERQKNYERRLKTEKSILDFVLDDVRFVSRGLNRDDALKLDEYLTGVREIEERIQRAEVFGDLPISNSEVPNGIPTDYGDHIDIMYDLLIMALQTDSTRIASLLLAGDGTNRPFPEIGIPQGHHDLSHHRGSEESVESVRKIDHYYVQHFARFLERMEQTKDTDCNSLLHNSMIVYGSGHADGNRHSHLNLPVILAGGGGGALTPGRYVSFDSQPCTNLFLSMADRLGVDDLQRFGDSTGRIGTI